MNLRPAWAAETLSFWDTRLPYPQAAANHSLVMRRAEGPWLVPRAVWDRPAGSSPFLTGPC